MTTVAFASRQTRAQQKLPTSCRGSLDESGAKLAQRHGQSRHGRQVGHGWLGKRRLMLGKSGLAAMDIQNPKSMSCCGATILCNGHRHLRQLLCSWKPRIHNATFEQKLQRALLRLRCATMAGM